MTPDKIQTHVREMLLELAKIVADPASIEVESYTLGEFSEALIAKLPNGDSLSLVRDRKRSAP